MKKQDFTVLKIDDLHPFPDNPFRLVEDELLMELSESIKEFGVVTPIITRPKEDGNGYEVIAGQRRVRASQLAGIETVPAFVLPLDRDRAIITLELTAENLNLLVERIEVYDRTETNAGAEQMIKICYRFGGYIGERVFPAKVLKRSCRKNACPLKERKGYGKISLVS